MNLSQKRLTLTLLTIGLLSLGSACTITEAGAAQHFDSKILKVTPEKVLVKSIPDVVYSQVSSRGFQNVNLQMDILQPQKKIKMPAIIYVTGGGFINANRANGIQERLQMADNGYVVASINYRVAPTATFPEPLEDLKSAIRYLKVNAHKFNIDAERIGIIGGSAGGYLTAMAGVTNSSTKFDKGDNLQVSSSVKCAVDLYGVSDLTKIGDDYSEAIKQTHKSAGATEALWLNGSPVFGGRDGGIMADPKAADAANPVKLVNKDSAPMLLMHGTADTIVSPSQTDLLFQALRENNIPAERYEVTKAAHGGVYWVQKDVMDVILNFFDKYLKQ